MHFRVILLSLAVTGSAVSAQSAAESQIKVTSAPAAVKISLPADGRRLIRLPALEFSLTIEPQCETGMQAESLSISVADTRKTMTISADDDAVIATTLTIPRQQTAPLAVVDFCQESRQLLVADVFTAHLSLRCINEEQQAVIYASHSLDLTLSCERADQDPSADSTER